MKTQVRCEIWCRTICCNSCVLLAMEPPNSFAADAVRDEKSKVLRGVVP